MFGADIEIEQHQIDYRTLGNLARQNFESLGGGTTLPRNLKIRFGGKEAGKTCPKQAKAVKEK
jgi:hypothetical protein